MVQTTGSDFEPWNTTAYQVSLVVHLTEEHMMTVFWIEEITIAIDKIRSYGITHQFPSIPPSALERLCGKVYLLCRYQPGKYLSHLR